MDNLCVCMHACVCLHERSVLSLQGQRAADKINRRSLDTLTTQSTQYLRGRAQSVSVCKVQLKDVKRHLMVRRAVWDMQSLFVGCFICLSMTTRWASPQQEAIAALDAKHTYKIQKTRLRQKFKASSSSSTEQNILTIVY